MADLLLVALAVADAVLSMTDIDTDTSTTLAYAASLIAAGALLLRRRFPYLTFLLTVPGLMLTDAGVAALVALYSMARSTSKPVPLAAGTVVVFAGYSTLWQGPYLANTLLLNSIYGLMFALAPLALGLLVRTRQELATRIAEFEQLQLARESLVIAREQERRRIGRDLHDGLGPVLSGVGFMVDALRERVRDLPEVEVSVDDVRAQIREASQLIRRVARELRPTAVDQLGLLQALRELVAQHKSAGLQIGLATDVEPQVLTPAAEVAAYAIAAEALTNVVRHATATTCALHLAFRDDVLTITIDDNGTGIHDRRAGLGRVSMQERAEELGGTLRVGPSPLGGCRVEARLPVVQVTSASNSGAPDSGPVISAEDNSATDM